MILDNTQLAAIAFAATRPFTVIVGGAGYGKTTIIEHIAKASTNVFLCAFAGKASARLTEATGIEASTIHRLLQYNGISFRLETLAGRTVIVDESSMISSDLLAEIIVRNPKRLILVGDEAQLPPVGKGQPFHDIIKHRPDCVIRLEKCYRNKEAVFKAALQIRAGEMPLERDKSKGETWTRKHTGNAEQTQKFILNMIRSGNIDFNSDVILTPRNGDTINDAATVSGLNHVIKELVNPSSEPFAINDRVINTKNFADENVWNGTTGSIHAIDHSGDIWVKLDTPIEDESRSAAGGKYYKDKVKFDKTMRKHLQLAYALTVHKSQGSQYRRVVFVCLDRDFMLLSRSLIYTAVTRTQEGCAVLGQRGAFHRGIEKVQSKSTVIQELAK